MARKQFDWIKADLSAKPLAALVKDAEKQLAAFNATCDQIREQKGALLQKSGDLTAGSQPLMSFLNRFTGAFEPKIAMDGDTVAVREGKSATSKRTI